MEKVFLQIFNMSITAGYCALAVMVLRLLMKKLPKVYSYALWLIVAFRLVCPVSFESVFSLMRASTETIPTNIATAGVPEVSTGNARVDVVVNNALAAISVPSADTDTTMGSTAQYHVIQSGEVSDMSIPIVDKTPVTPLQIILFAASLVWILVAAGFFGYGIGSYLKMRRELKDAEEMEPGVFASVRLQTPFVLGSFRPQIYLPADLSPAEKVYVLEHERTHIRRGDHLVKQAAFLLMCVYWFHPVLWAGYFLMCKDMEMSCDEKVIKKLSKDNALETKKNYASTLLALASNHQFSFGGPLAFGEGNIKKRISNVLQYKKCTVVVSVLLVGIVVLAALLFMGNPKDNKETGNIGGTPAVTETPVPDQPTETPKPEASPAVTQKPQSQITPKADLELLEEEDTWKRYYGLASDTLIQNEYFTMELPEEAVNTISYVLTVEQQEDGSDAVTALTFYAEGIMDTYALVKDCVKNGKSLLDIPTQMDHYFWVELDAGSYEEFEEYKRQFVLTNESGTGGMICNIPLDNIFSGSRDTQEEAERYSEITRMLNQVKITFHRLPLAEYTQEELEQYQAWQEASLGTKLDENVYYGTITDTEIITPLFSFWVGEECVNQVSYLLFLKEKADGTKVVSEIQFYYVQGTSLKTVVPKDAESAGDYLIESSLLGKIKWETLKYYTNMVPAYLIMDWIERVETVCIEKLEPLYLAETSPFAREYVYGNAEGTGAYFWYTPTDVQYTKDIRPGFHALNTLQIQLMSAGWEFYQMPDAVSVDEFLAGLKE